MVGSGRLSQVLGFLLGSAVVGACAAGSEPPPTGSAASGDPTTGPGGGDASSTADGASTGTVSTAQSASSGAPGSGGAGPGSGGDAPGSGGDPSGSGGAGGDPSGSGGAGGDPSGSGGAGGDPSGSGGAGTGGEGPTSGIVTFFAVKSNGVFLASRDASGAYEGSTLGGTYSATTRPALAMRNATSAVGLARGNADALVFATFNGSSWAAPAVVEVGVTTDDVPAIASALDDTAVATFLGTDGKHYLARYTGSAFDPVDDPVGGTGPAQAFGPSSASIAVVDGETLVVQAGDDDQVYALETAGAGWADAVAIDVGAAVVNLTPAVTAIDPIHGGDALIVYTAESTQLYWSIRDGGVWSEPVAIASALSADPPALIATPQGAVLAFRGTNDGVYAATFDGDGWGAPELVVPIATKTGSTPAVASGAGDADAELAFVRQSDGAIVHVRLQGGAFGAPTTVGGSGFTGVAIGASP